MSGTLLNAGVPSSTIDMYSAHTEYTFLLEKPKNKEETINKNVISVTCKGNGENRSSALGITDVRAVVMGIIPIQLTG